MQTYAVYRFTDYVGSTIADNEDEACHNVASNLDIDCGNLSAIDTGMPIPESKVREISQLKPFIHPDTF